jgi:predicted RNA-binding Zn-ribbon protein involved in translation (DUF1610 family)
LIFLKSGAADLFWNTPRRRLRASRGREALHGVQVHTVNLFAGLAFTETSLREKGRTMPNETKSRQENTRTCAHCGAAMRPVAHVPAFGREPPRDAFECPECGHVESFIRESRT